MQARAWAHIARRARQQGQLRVAAIGCSTTLGCGSNPGVGLCSPERGWTGHLHRGLLSAFAGIVPVRTSVYAKAAVQPTYFTACTGSFVPADADVVVLEMQQNLYMCGTEVRGTAADMGCMQDSLTQLVEALRRAAPSAALIFLNVLKPASLRAWAGSNQQRATCAAAAVDGRADLLTPTDLLLPRARHYARRGQDHHPSADGHQTIGTLAAWYLQQRLQLPKASPLEVAGVGWATGLAHDTPAARSQATVRATVQMQEHCFLQAHQLPVAEVRGGFAVRDEAGAKGVPKLGFVSNQPGDRLALRAEMRTGVAGRCWNTVKARLGYLLSTRTGQGAILVGVEGS